MKLLNHSFAKRPQAHETARNIVGKSGGIDASLQSFQFFSVGTEIKTDFIFIV